MRECRAINPSNLLEDTRELFLKFGEEKFDRHLRAEYAKLVRV